MLTFEQIISLVAATGTAVDVFDKISGQIKNVILRRPKVAEAVAEDWQHKIKADDDKIVVKSNGKVIQTITADQLSKLPEQYLALVKTYEEKMLYFEKLWRAVYKAKDTSPDPLVNAKVDQQLDDLVQKMKGELENLLDFLADKLSLQLDDHYLSVRHLVGDL